MVLFRPTIFVIVIQVLSPYGMACIPGASVYLVDRFRYFIVMCCFATITNWRNSFWVGGAPVDFESRCSPDDRAHLTVNLFNELETCVAVGSDHFLIWCCKGFP